MWWFGGFGWFFGGGLGGFGGVWGGLGFRVWSRSSGFYSSGLGVVGLFG